MRVGLKPLSPRSPTISLASRCDPMNFSGNKGETMTEPDVSKSSTRQILIFEPDEDQLKKHLAGRDISPELGQFLTRLMKGKKWPRKINIPSSHDNLAAAVVFSSELKKDGLEIFSELHVFFDGATIVEKWTVVNEADKISSLPKETFSSIEIEKVRLEDNHLVQVALKMALPGRTSKTVLRTFDFQSDEPNVRVVPHPFHGE